MARTNVACAFATAISMVHSVSVQKVWTYRTAKRTLHFIISEEQDGCRDKLYLLYV